MGSITTEDATFIASVGGFMASDFQLLQTNVETQIEEYLKRRVAALESKAQAEQQRMTESHAAEADRLHRIIEGLNTDIQKTALERDQCVARQGRLCERLVMHQYWNSWKLFAAGIRERRRRAAVLEALTQRHQLHSRWSAWRLFSAARKLRKRNETLMQSRERKLLAELEEMKRRLTEQERQQADTTEQRKTAFVRGVCALNREAVQVLRGETGEEDVEAIESILRGTPSTRSGHSLASVHSSSRPSTRGAELPVQQGGAFAGERALAPQQGAEEWGSKHGSGNGASTLSGRRSGTRDTSAMSGAHERRGMDICPVHHVDAEGNFYHPCFAMTSRQPQHTPFVVRVDPNAGFPLGMPAKKKR